MAKKKEAKATKKVELSEPVRINGQLVTKVTPQVEEILEASKAQRERASVHHGAIK